MANGDCVVGARHDAEIKDLQRQEERLRAVDQEQWEAINSVRNRPPIWATAVISLLMFLCGILGTLVVN